MILAHLKLLSGEGMLHHGLNNILHVPASECQLRGAVTMSPLVGLHGLHCRCTRLWTCCRLVWILCLTHVSIPASSLQCMLSKEGIELVWPNSYVT